MGNLTPRVFEGALTPDDLFAGAVVTGPVVILEDEQYFMAGAWAEKLAAQGLDVTVVTPWATPSTFGLYTNEQDFILERLLRLGVKILPFTYLTQKAGGVAGLECAYNGRASEVPCETLILCTGRLVQDDLFRALDGQVNRLVRVGECLQPSSIADAVYSGHRFAQLLGEVDGPPRREIPQLR